jgi:hypothetical protein
MFSAFAHELAREIRRPNPGRRGVLLGLAFYPFPNDRSTRHLRLKSEAGIDFFKNQERVLVWFFQLMSAF